MKLKLIMTFGVILAFTAPAEVKKRKSQQVVKIIAVDEGKEPVDDDTPIVLRKP